MIVYGVLGGLTAAYWTDLIQGLFIILLSVLLIPYGLWSLAKQYGGPDEQGLMDGFRIMHERVSGDYFNLFSGPSSGEFPVQYIISLTLLAIVMAIGLVVDDAIVVVENIHRHVEHGMPPIEAAKFSMKEVTFAVIAMTITLAAVFAPVGLMRATQPA